LGVLLFDRPESWAFLRVELRSALADLGWVEGSNLSVQWRFAEGDAQRLPALAKELSSFGVDAILTRGLGRLLCSPDQRANRL
jgi:putative ABC transport system substrate-binding protein